MRRSMSAKPGYPPLLCWVVAAGWIAAAPVGGVAVEDVVAGGWAVVVDAWVICGAVEVVGAGVICDAVEVAGGAG